MKFFQMVGRGVPYVLSLIVGFLITSYIGHVMFFASIDSEDTADRSYVIEPGADWHSVARDLEDKGFVRSWLSIYLPLKINERNVTIIPGEYAVKKSFSPLRIIEAIEKREIVFKSVTIIEGETINNMPAILAKTGLVTADEVSNALTDPELINKTFSPVPSLEGYIFPETYKFSRPITAKEMLGRMIDHGKKVWVEDEVRSGKIINLGLTTNQVLTLASIIQKEAGTVDDMPKISSVFHNRMGIGMPLQSDPTVIYGIPKFNGNLTRADLSNPSPYNTYMITGLPPTPISNPGLAAIDAALNPERTKYLYFVSRGDGSSQFSETLKDHNKAVSKYQKGIDS